MKVTFSSHFLIVSVSGINRDGILTSAVNIIMILPERKTESRNAVVIGGASNISAERTQTVWRGTVMKNPNSNI